MGKTKAIALNESAYLQAQQSAKKLNMSKSKYASAAIAFFAESGLDPTEERPQALAELGRKVGEGVANVRAHNANIGNNLFALNRAIERTVLGYLQQQQLSINSYLEAIESNMLRHLVALETNLLQPMLEQIFTARYEAQVLRGLNQEMYLKQLGQDESHWNRINQNLVADRDKLLAAGLQEFVKEHKLPAPRPNPKPGLTPMPTPSNLPAKPATPVAPAAPPKS